jgi:peptidoglycan/xylan/chitin deacetylase (PgdA/CDA1 family)
MTFLRQAAKMALASCVTPRWFLARGRRQAADQRPRLALTFDDGPHPEHTSHLLDLLESRQIRATFFVIGMNAERYPALIRRMAAAGHEIGNHTWSHSEPSQTSARLFLEEVRRTDALLKDLTGTIPRAMRPPKGSLTWTKLSGLWQQGKTVTLWNVDGRDYRMTSAGEAERWAVDYEPSDGDVLLFHDNHPWAATAIEAMLRRGDFDKYRSVAIGELAERACPQTRYARPPAAMTAPEKL